VPRTGGSDAIPVGIHAQGETDIKRRGADWLFVGAVDQHFSSSESKFRLLFASSNLPVLLQKPPREEVFRQLFRAWHIRCSALLRC
jgi:hypothetical protein